MFNEFILIPFAYWHAEVTNNQNLISLNFYRIAALRFLERMNVRKLKFYDLELSVIFLKLDLLTMLLT